MTPTLKLPIAASVVSLSALAVVELFLRPIADPIPLVLAVHVVIFGTLLALPRAPTFVVALLLLEIFVIRHFKILEAIGMAGGLLTLFTATFAAAALVPTRKVLVIVAVLLAHMAWRTTLPTATVLALYADCALFGAGIATGVMLQRRHRRLGEILAERDRLVAALERGPGEAATAEQLRTWSVLEQRIEPVLDALPGMVERAHDVAALEAIRARAADALGEMQATIRTLGEPPAVESVPTPPAAPGRATSPLWIACGLLLVAATMEMIVAREVSVFAPILALLPLLAPRAPIGTSVLVGVTAILCSLAGEMPIAGRAADFSAIITLVVAATSASPRRAAASLVLVVAGLMVSQGLDPTMDWPALAFIASAFIYFGHWMFGVFLRDVAAEQQQVDSGRAEIAHALEQLRARAVRAERVRLAHELHDLVGHALTAVAIQAGVATARLKRGLEPDYGPLAVAARQGTTELRRLATILGHDTGEDSPFGLASLGDRPGGDHPGQIAAEFARITDTARATGQQVELELDEPTGVDPQVRHAVVCVAAEALTNAAKHAAGATVHVRLKAREDRLELAVDDDGGARRELPGGGRGIDSMAHRVRACGGTFRSGPRAGGGWTVQAVLPLSA